MNEQRAVPSDASYGQITPRPSDQRHESPHSPALDAPSLASAHRRLVWRCRAIAVALGIVQAWAYRYEANPDGVSYLDIADAYREGRWSDAPNGYWSPLYPLVLAITGAIVRLPPSLDFVLSHVVNLMAYGAALVAFEYFLRGIRASAGALADMTGDPRPEWTLLGYALFLWATLRLIGLGVNTPDMLLAAAAFAVAGILTRVPLPGRDWGRGAMLGVMAGVGYLSKAAFFPLSVLIVFPVAGLLWWRSKRRILPAVVALASFVVVCAPHVIALSKAKGRITFSESGRIAYAWIVNSVHGQVHWQGGPPSAGTPVHPTRQISVDPSAYEFATPLHATYPPWYDPSYWYEGVRAHWDPAAQLRIAHRYVPLLLELLAPLLLISVATVVAAGGMRRWGRSELDRGWHLIVPGAAAIAMYASIFLETRYIAPFLVMLWFGALAVLQPFMPPAWRRGLFIGAAVVLLLITLPGLTPSLRVLSPRYRNVHGNDAAFVLRSGVRPGDGIAIVGDGVFAYWPRLARVRIVAEVPSHASGDFWSGDPGQQRALLEKLRLAGAVAVVTRGLPTKARIPGWQVQTEGQLAVLRLSDGGER